LGKAEMLLNHGAAFAPVDLRQRSDELNQVNGFFESILTSLRNGVVVLDRDLLVLVWNHQSEDLWGLRADEVRGKQCLNLDRPAGRGAAGDDLGLPGGRERVRGGDGAEHQPPLPRLRVPRHLHAAAGPRRRGARRRVV
jgi:PAS domain-containing protein